MNDTTLPTIGAVSLTADQMPSSGLSTGTITSGVTVAKLKLAFGALLNQAMQIFVDDRTLAESGNQSYDLNAFGGALDALGNAYALSRVVGILIVNLATDPTAILTVAAAVSDGFEAITGAAGTIAQIQPGGFYFITAPSLAALAVSSTTGGLKLTNGSSTVGLEYQIAVLGS